MRRDPAPDRALGERQPHLREFGVREIADAAMHHVRHRLAGRRGEIVPLDQRDRKPAPRSVARDRRADDAAADDGKVEVLVCEGSQVALHARNIRPAERADKECLSEPRCGSAVA